MEIVREKRSDIDIVFSRFKGAYCWKFRCGFLHNATLDIDDIWSDQNNQEFEYFKFKVSKGTRYGHSGNTSISYCPYKAKKEIEAELDIITFYKKFRLSPRINI